MIDAILHDEALASILTLALILALADFVGGVLAAWRAGTFTVKAVADFVAAHLLGRVIPIVAVAFVASALSAAIAGIQHPDPILQAAPIAAWSAAWAGILAYLVETLASLGVHVQTAQAGKPKT